MLTNRQIHEKFLKTIQNDFKMAKEKLLFIGQDWVQDFNITNELNRVKIQRNEIKCFEWK